MYVTVVYIVLLFIQTVRTGEHVFKNDDSKVVMRYIANKKDDDDRVAIQYNQGVSSS